MGRSVSLLASSLALTLAALPASGQAGKIATGSAHTLAVRGAPLAGGRGVGLTVLPGSYAAVRDLHRLDVLDFPLGPALDGDLRLERFHITTPATRIVTRDDEGERVVAPPEVALFRGSVPDRPGSRVVLAVTPDALAGVIDDGQRRSVLRPVPAGGWSHSLLPFDELDARGVVSECGVPPSQAEDDGDRRQPAAAALQGPSGMLYCRVALECDHDLWANFNDLNAALSYVYLVFGIVSDIYERDVSVKLALTYIRFWTTPNDPYDYLGGDNDGLIEFQNYWNQHHGPDDQYFIERDIAHLFSGRGVGAWANPAKLCDYREGYGISGGNGGGNIPHDVHLVAHEIGHNFNGKHTHCFDPPIDLCAPPSSQQCYPQDCSTAPSTIMSYCHNCGGHGMVIDEFHPLNIDRMLSHIAESCLQEAPDPTYVSGTNQSGIEDGSIDFPFSTVKEGIAAVAPEGVVKVTTGQYYEALTLWQPMTLEAHIGPAVIHANPCALATPIGPGPNPGSTIGRRPIVDETSCTLNDTVPSWHSYVAPCDGVVGLDTCTGTDFDTALAVFVNCVDTELACNDDDCHLGSSLTFPVIEGWTYYIRVSGFNGATGNYTLWLDQVCQ